MRTEHLKLILTQPLSFVFFSAQPANGFLSFHCTEQSDQSALAVVGLSALLSMRISHCYVSAKIHQK